MRGTQGVSAGAGAFGNGIPSLGLLICEMGLKFPWDWKSFNFSRSTACVVTAAARFICTFPDAQ